MSAIADRIASSSIGGRGENRRTQGHHSYRVSRRGAVKDVHCRLPADMPLEMQKLGTHMEQSLAQLNAPFPAEPVGIGARWTVRLVDVDFFPLFFKW